MTMLVVGLYDHSKEAQNVIDRIEDEEGIGRSDIELIEDKEQKEDQGFFKSLFGSGGGADLSSEDLREMGISRDDASFYAKAVHEGRSLVIVRCDNNDTEKIRSIMAEFNLSDYGRPPSEKEQRIEETPGSMPGEAYRGREEAYRGPEYAEEGEEVRLSETGGTEGRKHGKEETFEEVEEDVHVGKEKVETGGVRVKSEITEEPVEEELELKEERVDVERRPVDRAAGQERDLFEEEELEFTETREEPLIDKETRVTEEVVVGKETEEHIEKVEETARAKHVSVEDLTSGDSGRFEQFESDFERDYNERFAESGEDFDKYSVGYRYGMALAEHEDYRDMRWEEVEPKARDSWNASDEGHWNDYADAVRFGWFRIRGEDEERPAPRA